MKIRSFLILTFCTAVVVPSLVFGLWSYQDGVKREFSTIKDRHLLIAQNLGFALERYYQDTIASFEAVTENLASGTRLPRMERLLSQLNMMSVMNVEKDTGTVRQAIHVDPSMATARVSKKELQRFLSMASKEGTTMSGVTGLPSGRNVMYLVRDLGEFLSIGSINTDYFVALGKSISFGVKGHAAIVDQNGNVLAHPLPEWIASRKNIAKVSAVTRMMRGETGIEEFYSPALKGNMIAGLTSVPGPGWGVMVPQPVQEIYDGVFQTQKSVFLILGISLVVTIGFSLIMTRSLSTPLERLAGAMRTNARNRKLGTVGNYRGLITFKEIADFRSSYNIMVRRVTKAGEKIEALAYSDTITGLPNRDRLQAVAAPILSEADLPSRGGVMVLVDLDNFKEVNDLHGHNVGDEYLKRTAQKLKAVTDRLRLDPARHATSPWAEPLVARIGGDEFIVMVQGLVDDAEIDAFLQDLRAALSKPASEVNFIVNGTASIGCSRFPQDGNNVEELIKRADIAMYHAKNHGKNRSELYTPEIGTQTAAEMRRDLIVAIENDALTLEYQPKICTAHRCVNGTEALVRWHHPEFGRLMPGIWMPAIHETPAMDRLGEWVIERAMKDQKVLAAAGYDISMAVNVGSRHFVAPDFVQSIEEIRKRQNFDASKLEIEVTEDALFASEDVAVSVFNGLHEHGYKIAIDDYGKGYSNIARLAKLSVDYLKIDRSIIVGAYEDQRTMAILESTLNMAQELGCKTVAEGVETLQQAEFATRLGADCLQGYYFAPSMPINILIHWLEHQSSDAMREYKNRLIQLEKTHDLSRKIR